MTLSITNPSLAVVDKFPSSLQSLIDNIRRQPSLSPELAVKLVANASITAEDLEPWRDFNHPIEDSYGRKLIYAEDGFEILAMSWAIGDYSAIHDHGVAQWGAVQCFGAAEHNVYRFVDSQLTLVDRDRLSPGTINPVDSNLIHQMGNPGQTQFLSLHVYGSTADRDSVTGDARVFDLFEGDIQYTDGGVFFCLPDSDISYRDPGLQGDRTATLLHHQWMLARVRSILRSQQASSERRDWFVERKRRVGDRMARLQSFER